jgi:hypothetical protein
MAAIGTAGGASNFTRNVATPALKSSCETSLAPDRRLRPSMTAFVQLTFQLSPLAVTVTENPGSSKDTPESTAPSAHARSSAVFIGILQFFDPAPDHREPSVIERRTSARICEKTQKGKAVDQRLL